MIKQAEAPKFLTDSMARVFFPSLAKLEGAGDECASEILDNFVNQDMALYNWMIIAGEELVAKYGERLFPQCFGDYDIMRTCMQFGIPGHVTLVFEMSDNNYAALGVSFKDTVPAVLHVNDEIFGIPDTHGLTTPTEQLAALYDMLTITWDLEDGGLPDLNPVEGIYPPIVNCRRGFSEEDSPNAYRVMLAIREMVKAHSPHAEDILFTSESPECNIYHPDMILRAYDRHSGNYTHTWNFVWRDFAVQWYGRFTRSPNCNRELTDREAEQLLAEVKTILANHRWAPEPAPSKPLTPERLQAMTSKLQRNGRSGAF